MPEYSDKEERIVRREAKTNFNIRDMGDMHDEVSGKPDIPHRHDYYTVLLIEEATGNHIIDFVEFEFGNQEVHFVAPGQVHQVMLKQRPKGWFFTFSRDFLVENNIPETFISNINLFQPIGSSPPLLLDNKSYKKLEAIVNDMIMCSPSDLTYSRRALGALLQLFLIYCNNSSQLEPSQLDEKSARICTLRTFKQLIEKHYKEWHKVKEYASELNITPKHLSKSIKSTTGRTAKDHITDRILLESKRLLHHSNLNVKEIAYTIGFEEPLHFSGLFKRLTGVSPTAYRNLAS